MGKRQKLLNNRLKNGREDGEEDRINNFWSRFSFHQKENVK